MLEATERRANGTVDSKTVSKSTGSELIGWTKWSRILARAAMWPLVIVLILFTVAIVSSLWRYWSWYPKVWGTRVTVNGTIFPDSRLYAGTRRTAAVVWRREPGVAEWYFVGQGKDHGPKFVWRCEKFGFSVLPGLAFSNHVQFGQGCLSVNSVVVNWEGKPLSEPNTSRKRDLRVEERLIEFTADDGGRVRAEW
jgi:hypothetical protein